MTKNIGNDILVGVNKNQEAISSFLTFNLGVVGKGIEPLCQD